jgi:hypothetical protein
MIALRNEFAAFSRRADAKIGLLKEVIERIQNGEEVDVEGLLGTGDKKRSGKRVSLRAWTPDVHLMII